MKSRNISYIVGASAAVLALLLIVFQPFVIVNAGERGVMMKFGQVQEKVLDEGLHFIIPIVNTVERLSVRVQKHQIPAEAASKDLQDVYTDVALNWHIVPEKVNKVFQQVGNEGQIVQRIINPAIEEVLKAVMAQYTAEQIITRRGEVKAGIDDLLTSRLANYNVAVDDISLVNIHFSKRFSEAVEAKQIAEQDAKRAEFIALKAMKEAEAEINRAKGQAEAQRLLRENLTPEILQKQAIEKWDGHFPMVLGGNGALPFINLDTAKSPIQK
ncbi:MAG: prohibitin family protein [Oscillatoriaceae bacterium SKW80]|nr:prohibitin family protein [Oscillatoriaceae bacterium SKYG93]MCX8120158.1 prohibitin family protein [Oscillatoriaceae bacterium SKW80]MDW8453084.1 prohibitin family protein [Oscillatoriaceae cyanobacterium SKYGB_i_bin93]HIK29005.1 prohibitin family protein [Oscillatoriaceae cyanobacterium M7585_C2015_266]